MKKYSIAIMLCFSAVAAQAQQAQYLEAKTSSIDNEKFGIVKLLRKDNHVKVKYFAAKDNVNGLSVYQRYQNWAINKKVIAFSSGTYMDNCDANSAYPVGLCIDQGRVVNSNLMDGKLDALAIVYATGGMVASDLDSGKLKIVTKDNGSKTLDIRNSPFQKAEFMKWATDMEATVFQTHLFVYEDKIMMGTNSSQTMQPRRFLAVCKEDDGSISHYLINLPTASTIYNGVKKAYRILKEWEEVNQIVFMLNLDTGCQDVLSVFDLKGTPYRDDLLKGGTPISNSVNLLAYYYE